MLIITNRSIDIYFSSVVDCIFTNILFNYDQYTPTDLAIHSVDGTCLTCTLGCVPKKELNEEGILLASGAASLLITDGVPSRW